MKKAKTLFALLLTLVMLFGCLAGCAQEAPAVQDKPQQDEPQQSEPAEKEPEAAPPEEKEDEGPHLPLVDDGEEHTLTIGLLLKPNVENYDTNEFTLWLEEQTGVKIEFVQFAQELGDAMTQLALMMSSGEKLPDILWSWKSFAQNTMFEYGEDGYFVNLKPYFDEYAHFFWEPYNELPESDQKLIWAAGTDPNNGEYYSMPYMGKLASDSELCMPHINKVWLEKLGLEEPKNIDELYTFLKRAVAEDPNGNGKADELGMIGRPDGWRTDITDWVMNAFVYCDPEFMWNVTDGKVWAPFTTDEYRQGLIYMKKLYDEGLLAPMAFTAQTDQEMIPLTTPSDGNPKVGIWAGYDGWCTEDLNTLLYDYAQLAPLDDATGSGRGGFAQLKPKYLGYGTFITSDCADPVLAFRFLDFLYSQEAAIRMRYGVPDVDWDTTEGVDLQGNVTHIQPLPDRRKGVFSEGNVTWQTMDTMLQTPANNAQGLSMLPDASPTAEWSARYNAWYAEFYKKYQQAKPAPKETVGYMVYNSDEAEIVAEYNTDIASFVKESRAFFITGAEDPANDAAWQKYLDTLAGLHLDEVVGTVQTAYTRMYGNA